MKYEILSINTFLSYTQTKGGGGYGRRGDGGMQGAGRKEAGGTTRGAVAGQWRGEGRESRE